MWSNWIAIYWLLIIIIRMKCYVCWTIFNKPKELWYYIYGMGIRNNKIPTKCHTTRDTNHWIIVLRIPELIFVVGETMQQLVPGKHTRLNLDIDKWRTQLKSFFVRIRENWIKEQASAVNLSLFMSFDVFSGMLYLWQMHSRFVKTIIELVRIRISRMNIHSFYS